MNLPSELLRECFAHAQECYPEEACGFITGNSGENGSFTTVHRMENIMNRLHKQDPDSYPRNARDGYMIDPYSQLKLERKLKQRGEAIHVIYHSHPDVGAYFSEKDEEDALWNGRPRYPGVRFLVCGISKGQPDGAIFADFNEETGSFECVPLH